MRSLAASDLNGPNRADAPIATCHWQLLAHALKRSGHGDYAEILGLAWGCQFRGPGVLFGAMTWNQVLTEVCGVVVTIERFGDPVAARTRELDLSAAGRPFVAEVDEYHLPGHLASERHVIHAVLVLERSPAAVRFLAARSGDQVMTVTGDAYETMRGAPCRGRVEPMKLYALTRDPIRKPSPAAVLSAVRRHLGQTHARSTLALEAFLRWAGHGDGQIDVCRAAGERYQAAKLFRHLAAHGVPEVVPVRDRLVSLADDWYLVHMLGTYDDRLVGHRRERVIRLLERLVDAEREVTAMVLR
ncbi:hypothetical protein [Verrucosispora sp. TAA-831]|uniref:hypothetical protein n=1 Tax=Verrucosispora sp. TAA-831 TaxID=3422227 RepID=UPI003D6E1F75